jgi:leader peptidase (prepilin peptidase)/N-methyltransferase
MEPGYYYPQVFAAFAFVLGAVVGSFLNVCIYRLPLGLSVNEPRRSFCPHCKNQIPWRQNLPLISWLALRGKCAQCGNRIPFRYFCVELLTAGLFLAIWLKVPWILALPYGLLAALLVVATFIDLEHFIIPDEITIGGTAAGVMLSFAIPPLMGRETHLAGLFHSLLGAGVGFLTLRLVVELGKLAFGKKRITLEPAEDFTWTRHGEEAELRAGGETTAWSEFFSRETDQLLMQCTNVGIAGVRHAAARLRFFHDRVLVEPGVADGDGVKTPLPGGGEFRLDDLDVITGTCSEITIPREAMGLGDVKFIAAIGAFLGWQAVFFSICSASVVGAVAGLLMILLGKREWSAKIPFGPYLALGALLWIFAGPETIRWYFHLLSPAP